MKKYELTSESIEVFGKTLYRIKALVSFADVQAGDLGGFIEKEQNLSHSGNAWVYGNARVYGNAWVCDDAQVYGNAWVCDDAHISDLDSILWISNIGSRYDTTTFFRTRDNQIAVKCGCFRGTLDEFLEKVKDTHGDNKYAQEYRLAAELTKVKIKL